MSIIEIVSSTPSIYTPAVICGNSLLSGSSTVFRVSDYHLGNTLNSGQAFRWENREGFWEGVVGSHWVRLSQSAEGVVAESAQPQSNWSWLVEYLQLNADYPEIIKTFPDDEPMQQARRFCAGLRLLKQDPWECLASFILSSTKQIVQIRQIVALLCSRYGEKVNGPGSSCFAFPTPKRLADVSEKDLRDCKMGFRAPYLRAAARLVADHTLRLEKLQELETAEARERLLTVPGVGPKIADCVLLFAYGFHDAFPIDVWIAKALQDLYFGGRSRTIVELRNFADEYFGPFAGYAQQYLFHFVRMQGETQKTP